jgi:hypothetical protein
MPKSQWERAPATWLASLSRDRFGSIFPVGVVPDSRHRRDMGWIPIRYRDFYDVPRSFALEWQERCLFFDCPFDESADEYGANYFVYRVDGSPAAASDRWPWPTPRRDGQAQIATVPVSAVVFDPTRRRAIRSEVLSGIVA